METHGAAFAALIGRLRLTQGEVRRLLGISVGTDVVGIMPGQDHHVGRSAAVAHALHEALDLVGDDALVARWLRSPLSRRGGASPLDEVETVAGDTPIRFVLQPHPTELVRLLAGEQVAAAEMVAAGCRVEVRAGG